MLLTRRRSRTKFNKLYPHIIISKSDKLLKSLTIQHIACIVIIGFFILFGFLALYLPRDTPHRTFIPSDGDLDTELIAKRIESEISKNKQDIMNIMNIDREGHVQIFYYPWYGNPENDGEYIHWNHDILPHWEQEVNAKYKIGEKYEPLQDEIGASFYPLLGAYSSSDKNIIHQHFLMLLKINISVIVVSWHSPVAIKNNPNKAFSEKDKITANNLDLLFKYAPLYGMRIAIHLEPYNGRTAESTYQDLKYLNEKYSKLDAYYKSAKYDNKPFFYVYDSYKMENSEWKKLLIKGVDDKLCVRDTELDGVFLGLYLNRNPSEKHIIDSGFDGFYTYFAADGFTDGSSPNKHWKQMAKWSLQNNLIFVPSIGPGYNDLRVRPWNAQNSKDRKNGDYYKMFWNEIFNINDNLIKEMNEKTPHQLMAKDVDDVNDVNDEENEIKEEIEKEENDDSNSNIVIEYVSITSFNEWHEGTQIEPSISKTSKNGYKYMDFENEGGRDAYMQMTHALVNTLLKQLK